MKTKYYKHILLAALCLTQIKGLVAQEDERCATTKMMEAMYNAHPEMRQAAIEYEKALQKQIQEHRTSRSLDTAIYYIPVVFHVLHTNGSENISDAQIQDEITHLNLNYRNLNTSLSTVVPGFDSIAADARIQFRLATIDPNGHCTNGIDRIYSHLTNNADDNSKLNPWPRDKYLNVWTIRTFSAAVGAGVLAYAQFPNSSVYQIPTDGVIMKSSCVGTIGTSSFQYGITLTHEIGHYLNLFHVWGNTAVETACGDDAVDDTPITKGRQSKCSMSELYTPICTINTITNGYTYDMVSPTSGVTDTTATPFAKTLGADFGKFKAVGVSANSSNDSIFSFSNWDTGAANGDTTFANLTGSINTAKYYEVKITPNIRYSATLTGITFNFQRSATGVRSYAVRSSVDGFTNNLTASSSNPMVNIRTGKQFFSQYDTTDLINGSSVTLSGAAYTNFITPITFRFYGWNAEDAAGTFGIDDVTFIGTVGAMENVQNYMDYSWCLPSQCMFTIGQVERMRTAITNVVGQRDYLHRPGNLAATGVTNPQTCVPVPDFSANRYNICAGSNVTFTKNILNATASSWTWTFPGGTPSTSTITSPTVTYSTPGIYDVKLVASNTAGTDSVTKIERIHVYDGNNGYIYGPYTETFEATTTYWAWWINDVDNNSRTWAFTNTTGYSGTRSVVMKGYNNDPYDIDELWTSSYDLSNLTNATLTFRCAAASRAQTSADLNDVLNVYSTNNCGQTWSLRTAFPAIATPPALPLINNGFHSESYVPSSASQWALLSVPIPNGVATSNVRFKFEYITGNKSNNIYIDDVNVNGTVGIKENTDNGSLSIYPNPTNQTSTIYYHLTQKANVRITLVDVLGKVISDVSNNAQAEGDHSMLISKQELNLNNGIYFIKFSIDNNTVTRKLIITE